MTFPLPVLPPKVMPASKPSLYIHDDGGAVLAGHVLDQGNCFPRALSISTGLGYQVARAMCLKALGLPPSTRYKRRMSTWLMVDDILRGLGYTKVFAWDRKIRVIAKKHPDCIISVRGHVLAVVRGMVRDNFDSTRRHARWIYVKPKDLTLPAGCDTLTTDFKMEASEMTGKYKQADKVIEANLEKIPVDKKGRMTLDLFFTNRVGSMRWKRVEGGNFHEFRHNLQALLDIKAGWGYIPSTAIRPRASDHLDNLAQARVSAKVEVDDREESLERARKEWAHWKEVLADHGLVL